MDLMTGARSPPSVATAANPSQYDRRIIQAAAAADARRELSETKTRLGWDPKCPDGDRSQKKLIRSFSTGHESQVAPLHGEFRHRRRSATCDLNEHGFTGSGSPPRTDLFSDIPMDTDGDEYTRHKLAEKDRGWEEFARHMAYKLSEKDKAIRKLSDELLHLTRKLDEKETVVRALLRRAEAAEAAAEESVYLPSPVPFYP